MCLWRQFDQSLINIEFSYLEISRKTVRLACIRTPGDLKLLCKDLQYTKTFDMAGPGLAEYFALPREWIAPEVSVEGALEQLAGPLFSQVADRASIATKSLEYAVFSFDCFVDIGWRGTMSVLLDRAIPAHQNRPWLFLAHWCDRSTTPLRIINSGLLADSFCRKSLIDKSLWDLVGFFEPFCKGNFDGGLRGYYFPHLSVLRKRVLSLVEKRAPACTTMTAADESAFVAKALRGTYRLANFPSTSFYYFMDTISLEHGIEDWTEPTSQTHSVNPILHPKRWLLGFACPWKGGWAYRSAGLIGAYFWICVNYFLMHLGPGFIDFSRTLVSPSSKRDNC